MTSNLTSLIAEGKLDVSSESSARSAESATVHVSLYRIVASFTSEGVLGEIDKGLFDKGFVRGCVAVWRRGGWQEELVVLRRAGA